MCQTSQTQRPGKWGPQAGPSAWGGQFAQQPKNRWGDRSTVILQLLASTGCPQPLCNIYYCPTRWIGPTEHTPLFYSSLGKGTFPITGLKGARLHSMMLGQAEQPASLSTATPSPQDTGEELSCSKNSPASPSSQQYSRLPTSPALPSPSRSPSQAAGAKKQDPPVLPGCATFCSLSWKDKYTLMFNCFCFFLTSKHSSFSKKNLIICEMGNRILPK